MRQYILVHVHFISFIHCSRASQKWKVDSTRSTGEIEDMRLRRSKEQGKIHVRAKGQSSHLNEPIPNNNNNHGQKISSPTHSCRV